MTKKEKEELITTLINHYRNFSLMSDQVGEIFGGQSESKFFSVFFKAFDDYESFVSKTIGDHFCFVSWYIYDCQCGESPMECEIDGKKRMVESISDLVEVIDACQK